MSESSEADTNDMMSQIGRIAKKEADNDSGDNENTSDKVEISRKAGTKAAPADAEVLFLTEDRTSSRKVKTNGKLQDDKEVAKKKRRNVQPAVINNDGICFSNNGQYHLDMSKRSELYAGSEKWVRTLCSQNKV